MGWSFRKSFKLGPIRLNFSKSGIGASTGVGGANISTGPRGTYASVSKYGVRYSKRILVSKVLQSTNPTIVTNGNVTVPQSLNPVIKPLTNNSVKSRFMSMLANLRNRIFSNQSRISQLEQKHRREIDAKIASFRADLIAHLTAKPPKLFDFKEIAQNNSLSLVYANNVAESLFMDYGIHAARDGNLTIEERNKLKALATRLNIDENRAKELIQFAKMVI